MIFVTLGTQDKEFKRLLEALDKEIEKNNITDKVIVQKGYTKYKSNNMEMFDFLSTPDFEKYIEEADLVITHGGVGSILNAIKKGKKVIATPRLKEFNEHENDHQKQIIEEFSKEGYILELNDLKKITEVIEKSTKFKPKKFESNTDNMIKLIEEYIQDTNHKSWINRYYYLVIGIVVLILIIILITYILAK